MSTVSVHNGKGGVGKTTLTGLIAQYLAGVGFRVGVLDLDRQGAQTALFDLDVQDERFHRVLRRELSITDALTGVDERMIPQFSGFDRGGIWVAQGGPQTEIAIDQVIASPLDFGLMSNTELLVGPVEDLSEVVDFVVIDLGPSDQRTMAAALVCTDYLLVPTTMDYLSVQRIGPVLKALALARQRLNPNLQLLGIVPTMTQYYFGGLRASKNVQAGKEFLETNYAPLLMRDSQDRLIDLPYNEDWQNVMWTGEPLLGPDTSRGTKEHALRFLNVLGQRLGLENARVSHVA